MSDLTQRVANLSPEKRALLTLQLAKKKAQVAPQQAVPRRRDPGSFPLSFAQERLWFLDQYEPDSPFYNIAAALRLTGPLDVTALAQSFDQIARRHEVLRATFMTAKGYPLQVIAPSLNATPLAVDLRDLPQAGRETEALRLATKEAQRPFDLSQGPLLRACLLRLDASEHIVLLTMHHIVSDGWSMSVLIREMALLYDAFSTGKPLPLPDLPIQYADFACWQREWLRGAVLERQLDYWKQQLGGDLAVLELPTDRPRPAIQTHHGAHYPFVLSKGLSQALETLSRQEGVTLFMLLLAAFQTLLYRYTGQQDISVGAPIANRNRAEIEGLIGFFVNTLVMRTNLTSEPGFRELLRRVREVALGAYAHQDVPFEMLVDVLRPERSLSHTPLFQVVFALQDALTESIELSDLRLHLLEIENGTAKFDLTLFVEERADGLAGTLEYNTDLFDAATIERLTGHFQTLLAGIVADPDRCIADLPLLTVVDRQQLLSELSGVKTDYPREQAIGQLFEAQVEQTPESIAIVLGEEQITYRELNRRANQLAHYLQALGVRPEVTVGILVERSLEMVVAHLSILKAGGVYLPLDAEYPQERLAFMLADSRAPMLLTQHRMVGRLPEQPARVMCLDTDWPTVAAERETNPDSRATADNLAYVMYTSGSTGRPKGVSVVHRGVVRLVRETTYARLDADQVFLQLAPISFDASTLEIWGPLLNGGRLVVMPAHTPSLAEIGRAVADCGVTILWLTASLFHLMVDERLEDLKGVRQLLAGGDVLSVAHVRRIVGELAASRMINGYGPTENTTFTTCYAVADAGRVRQSVPIGYPIANTQVYILDGHMQPAPVGVAGELYVGGEGLARGYLNRPELTAAKFVPHPFDGESQARLYRTGDLARYLPDGSIEFLGRMDYQVKIRGFRIELGEIQTVLGRHPGVRDVVVMAREDTPGDKRLAAYVVPEEDTLDADDLRSFLREKLPEYMVPSAFTFLDVFPVSPSGKVDRRALPAPDRTRADLPQVYVAPRSAVERLLVERWQEVLGLDRVGIHDNFFELGGDSLQAAVLINRLQEELNVTAHVKALFMAPTVAEMGRYMAEYYPDSVAKIGQTESLDDTAFAFEREIAISDQLERVDASTVGQIRQLIPPLPPREESDAAPGDKNPPAIFILSPPRSGSTLLRTMLAGHPRLFSPPELDLLSFNTLAERRAACSGARSFWLEGVFRAIMEARDCDVQEAQRLMEEYESQKLSTKQFYRLLQEWIGSKILVDKTPVYPLDLEILKRMEADFDDALYIHLVRHPYATLYSFVEAKLDQVFFRHEHPFSRRVLAELVWIISHQNILKFLETVPKERQHRIVFEDLVTQPEAVMQEVCRFLDVAFHTALVQPYDGQRMTNGVRPGAQMVGDFKFYLRREIDAGAADRWTKFHTVDFLSDVSWQVAQSLGYERFTTSQAAIQRPNTLSQRKAPAGIRPIPRDGDLPLSFAQQRLWFLDQFGPGSPFYNIPSAVRLTGRLNVTALEQSFNEIVRRHQILRTAFATVDGRAVQVIAPVLALPLPVVDLLDVSQDEREAVARRLAAEEAHQPFDLAQGPLVRACLLRLDVACPEQGRREEHVFLLTAHHIVSDGWSTRVLIREVGALYEAFSAGKPSPLPELPVQYIDYAYWQRQWLQGEVLESQLAYWKRQLDGSPPILELPTDWPRPVVQTLRGTTLWFELPKSLSDAIRTLSRQTKASLFMALLAAFKALLYRYTGQEDILVGTPIANRSRVEIEGLIGFFANTLVLRTDLSGDPGFRELLGRVREVAAGAYAHQDVPFEMLVDELQPKRDMSYTPLFQVMFTIQDASMEALKLSGLTLSSLKTDSGTAKFDLTLSIVDKAEGLRGSLEYNADLFDGGTTARLAGHFQTLLEGIVAHPDRPIPALPLLTGAERQQMLAGWGDTAADYPRHTSIPHLFEAQVAQTPDAVAVVFQEEQLTYAGLNRRANQLARHLQKLDVGPETLVGLCVERSLETVLGVVGILKAGGAYVPLDPTYPKERLAFMQQDAQISVLLTQERLVADLPTDETGASLECGRRLVLLDADWQLIARESDDNPAGVAGPENLAYIIYTSGSTGRPKGSMIQHRSALHLATALQRAIYVSLPDTQLRLSLNAPLPFDASVQQLIMLLYGHALCIVPQEARLDGAALLTYLRHNQLDVLDCVPSQLKLLLAAGLLDGTGRSPLAVLPGGEAIDEATWRALAKAAETEFYNMYGPTECAVDSTIGWVKAAGERSTIGRPVANAQLYVLDRRLQPTPIGVPGELHIGGTGVGRGYLHRPDLTAEKFVPHPLGDEPGARLYKTGDLVRYLPDGNVEFLGRIDHQVKVRGFRIELGEIEAVLKRHPALREVVALAREDTPSDKRLVAYLVAAQEPAPTVSDLRSFLKEKLPEYMLPSAFVTLETLPLLPNGKVNRRALPAPAQSRPEMEVVYVSPRTQKEEILANVWRQVLGVEQVGVHDDFFELGGDSILSIQVIARANQAGLRLTPRQLFESPTVAGLAAVAGTAPLVQAEQGVVEGPVPLTPIQRWFFEQDLPELHHWNQAVLLEVEQPLTAVLLKAVVEHLVAHHDALRLRFEHGESGWQQVNAGIGGKVPFRWVNLSRLSEKDQRLAVETHAAALQGSLDLTAGPLLRVAYFDLGAERPGRLLIVVHHLAIDGVSWRILLQDFQTAYRQLGEAMAVQLPPKTTSFRHWARRFQEYARSEALQAELPRWLAIAQNGVTRLPVDYSGGVNIEASASSVKVSLVPEETKALLQEVPAAYGTEINDTLLTALVQAMARWTGSRALLVDLEGHGREDILDGIDLSRTVGWFTTIYPVSLDLEDTDSPGEALKAVKEQLRRIPQRGIGYGLLRYLGQDKEVSKKLQILPQAEVSFNYLGQFDPALSEAGPFRLARESHGSERSLWSKRSHLLSINGSITNGRLQLEWIYSENLHRRATIERLAQDYIEALRALIAHCRSPEAGGYTPSDFPEAQLSQEDLDTLMLEIGEAIGDH